MTSIDELASYGCCKSVFSKKGRYGGSYGHVVLAFHFAKSSAAAKYAPALFS